MIIHLCILLLCCLSSLAASHYIVPGESGTGSAWNDALGSLPVNLTRGDTYWLADGNYGTHEYLDNESGSTYIYITKATASNHGTETGWQASYGDGQANFTAIQIISKGYYYFNGGAWIGWPSTYGFNSTCLSNSTPGWSYGVYIDTKNDHYISHVTLIGWYIDMSASTNWPNLDVKGIKNDKGDQSLFSNIYIKNFGDGISTDATTNSIYEYFFIERAPLPPGCTDHGDAIVFAGGENGIVRYSKFNWDGQQVFFSGDSSWYYPNFKVHNCLLYGGETSGKGVYQNSGGPLITNLVVYNCTFSGMNITIQSRVDSTMYGDVQNCIFWNCGSYDSYRNVLTHSYDFYPTGTVITENNKQLGSDPFISDGIDFRLKSGSVAIGNGNTLDSQYAVDLSGATRTVPWDMGAYELSIGRANITNLRVNNWHIGGAP